MYMIKRFFQGMNWKTHLYQSKKSFDFWWDKHLKYHKYTEKYLLRGMGDTGKDAECAMRGYKNSKCIKRYH